MTLTLAEDCSSITVASNNFNATNTSNELIVTHNATEYTIPVDADNVDPVVINAASLSLDEMPEGVFLVTLKTTDDESAISTEQVCISSICSLHCDMIPLYADSTNIERVLAYEALKLSSDCVTCSCTVMQKLYDKATETTNATPCNCQSA